MDLETTETTISIIGGVIFIGGALYGVFRRKINGFVRSQIGRQNRRSRKQCPQCGKWHNRGAIRCGRCNWQFLARTRPRKRRA